MNSILKYIFSIAFIFILNFVYSQYVTEIIEYKPAPGQFINDQSFGSPDAAESIIDGTSGLISLGAFGGYIIVKMDNSIENHPDNPFGMDFTILGNALPDWSEAATVEVMKDENNNGLADDQWYLLAGSDYYFNQSELNYSVTYYNPNENTASDVLWVDIHQDSGYVYKNSFHQQVYYPLPNLFPTINQNSYSLNGMKVKGNIDLSNPSMVKSYERNFGFADNRMRGSQPYNIPDNPYTPELENAGGDAMDISWARDENGSRIELDKIDFIKITNAMNATAGGLGEISTEISGIIDVIPNASITGEMNLLAISDMPKTISIHNHIQAEAIHFIAGIPAESQNIIWSSSNTAIATVNANGLVSTHSSGSTTITAKLQNQEPIFNSFEIQVSEPSSIEIILESASIHAQNKIEIHAITRDQNDEEILGLETEWSSQNTELLEILEENNKFYIKGLEEGSTYIYAQVKEFPQIIDSVQIQILAESNSKKVYISIQTEDDNIIARQSLWVDHFDLNPYVDHPTQDYGIGSIEHISLAHAIATIFNKVELGEDLRFKDDEAANGSLYLWKVPQEDNASLNFYYGYGGNNSDESKSRAWIVKLNNHSFARNMHEIEIQDEDEILVYHVTDSRQEWITKHLVLSSDSAKSKQAITASYIEEKSKFYESGIIELLERNPIDNASLFLNGESLIIDGHQVRTNDEGEAIFSIENLGQHYISINEETARVIISNATGVEEIEPKDFNIYPNPFEESFQIASPKNESIETIQIYNTQGQLIIELKGESQANLKTMKSGFYLCRIISKGQMITKKILKK